MKDHRFKKLNLEPIFFDAVVVGVIAAFMGGRILYIVSERETIHSFLDFFAFWQGGLAILGGVIGTLVGLSLFLWYKKIPILPFFDLIALHAPLLQAVSRIGCFFAGCCYGKVCNFWWAVHYTDDQCLAPTDVWLHPTQLYSVALLFAIFLFMYFYVRKQKYTPGMITVLYLILISTERFLVDFWRDSRCIVTPFFSYNQIVAIGIVVGSLVFLCILLKQKKK